MKGQGMVTFRKFAILLLAIVALFATISRSWATVVPVGTLTPDSVTVGETVELDLRLSLFTDFGFVGPALFKTGTVTIFSGESGASPSSFSILPGVNVQDITANVVYTQAGDYTPSFTIHAIYTENALGLICHRSSGCQTVLNNVSRTFNFSGLFFDPSADNLREFIFDHDVTVTAAIPELSTWGMMMLGFGALALFAQRRPARTRLAAC